MDILPPIENNIEPRPGKRSALLNQFIPATRHQEFWDVFYSHFRNKHTLHLPFDASNGAQVNPFFGNYGYRWHPSNGTPNYFHAGTDFSVPPKTEIIPLAEGILEYSGYGVYAGNYVLLSHPKIKTEDGFMMYTSYMHLKTTEIKFTAYQKMLREISLRTYPNIVVHEGSIIGTAGLTAETSCKIPSVHIQVEMRNAKGKTILLDPARLLGVAHHENVTAEVQTIEELKRLHDENIDLVQQWQLEECFRSSFDLDSSSQ